MPLTKLNATLGLTGSLPAVSGANLTNIDAGKVLQVSSGSFSSQASTTSNSYVDANSSTNLDFTCSATSSKVLIIAEFHGCYLNGTHAFFTRVLADSTEVLRTDYNIHLPQYNGEKLFNNTETFLYSPSSTSQITYKLQFASTSNGQTVRLNQNSKPATSLILMEIGA
tara:strand:+ start:673 stop:1176 length:504 start_codon:yes stop_codon:yes gene_type:complete